MNRQPEPSIEWSDALRQHLDELLTKACDQRIQPGELAELDRILRGSARARSVYCRYMNLHATLHTYLHGETEAVAAVTAGVATAGPVDAELPAGVVPMIIPPGKSEAVRPLPKPRVNPVLLALAAMVVFGLGVAALEWVIQIVPETPDAGPVLATLAESVDASWAPGAWVPQKGESLGNRRLQLKSGIIRVDFGKGASTTIQGEADLEILTDNSLRLASGRLYSHVPKQASGFTIRTGGFDFIDIGTKFGAMVLESGAVQLQVLEGEVELAVQDDNGRMVPIQTVRGGYAVLADPGQRTVKKIAFDPAPFHRLQELE